MLIRRKEAKSYGTKKLIEGKYQTGETCLIIEDVVTTGSSILETTNDLRAEGLIVTDAIVVVDRQQGGSKNLTENGVLMHSLFTLPYLIDILCSEGKIEEGLAGTLRDYIAKPIAGVNKQKSRLTMSFAERADSAKSEVSRALLQIMHTKKTNLCLAADMTKCEEVLNLADSIGTFLCLLKLHVDIVEDFNDDFVRSLKAIAEKHNFMIMEDRKFADIGNTTSLQCAKGIYKISSWANLVTAHSLPGEGILKGLKEAFGGNKAAGVFLLAEMSSEGNLLNADYSKKTMEMAEKYSDIVSGIVAQSSDLLKDPGMIQLTPGCKLEESGDNLGQQYNTPEHLIREKGADIAVVGRGIISSKNPTEIAKTYRDRLWAAFEARLKN
jgi:uridine monophosphate synthetase